jgi:hypothetical protein
MDAFPGRWFGQRSNRVLTGLSAALLSFAGAFAQPVAAVPISYELDDVGGNASGTFAGTPFSNALVILTFEADTTTVVPFTVPGPTGPASGYVNLVGTGTVTVLDVNGTTVGYGTFLPSAGIFISVDNTNGGIGVGSFGVPPSNPSFPGQVAYPAGMLVSSKTATATYDLKSDISLAGFAISCVGFPVPTCPAGIPLPTTAGDLILDHQGIAQADFAATVQPVTPFSSLNAEADVESSSFVLIGQFSLGAASNGINPSAEAVTLQLDSYSVTIPPGSFTRTRLGGYKFRGKIGDVRLQFSLTPDSPSSFRFHVQGAGAGLPQLANPLSVQLTIGDDSGADTVTARN